MSTSGKDHKAIRRAIKRRIHAAGPFHTENYTISIAGRRLVARNKKTGEHVSLGAAFQDLGQRRRRQMTKD